MNFLKLRCLLPKIGALSMPNLTLNRTSTNQNKSQSDILYTEKWTPFFKFPYIVQARLISRLKLYQSALVIGSVPLSFALYQNEAITLEQLNYTVGLMGVACTMLYVMGNFFRKLIGIMYINDSKNMLKISHLTFFGNRRDLAIPVDDVVMLTDTGYIPNDIYIKFKRYSSEEHLYFVIKTGGVLDRDTFVKVFGNPN